MKDEKIEGMGPWTSITTTETEDDGEADFREELAKALTIFYSPLPKKAIKHNTRGNGYDYIPVTVAINLLNSVVGDWDFHITDQEFVRLAKLDFDGVSYGNNDDTTEYSLEKTITNHAMAKKWGMGECVVTGILTLRFNGRSVSRSQIGSSALNPSNPKEDDFLGFTGSPIGECYKAAASDCLKKCATLFGISLTDLYPDAQLLPFSPQFVSVDKEEEGPPVASDVVTGDKKDDDIDFV